ncbi:N-acetylmuramoyl-L-alanine amidase [Flavobacterium sp.]
MFFFNTIKVALFSLLLLPVLALNAQTRNSKFTVVLDAGHGGKDPGNSYHGFVEKDISLKTTLKVGEYLEAETDFEVVYTRKSDVFIELVNRPKVANKINANLFVSIHCNSVNNFEPAGTETFVMGLSRTDMNMEVAKSENSVIFLEDDYKKIYKGFDPHKPETLLGLKLQQEENLYNSINLASGIQNNFTNNLSRKTRGVKQQPLWVLDAAYMPSVLIELGFLSNKEEGEFLNSDAGQNKMARQIADAIIEYKRENFNELVLGTDTKKVIRKEIIEEKIVIDTSRENSNTVSSDANGKYKVQLFATSRKRDVRSSDFKGLKRITYTVSNNLYKYYYGAAANEDDARKLCDEAKGKGFTDAFIVSF